MIPELDFIQPGTIDEAVKLLAQSEQKNRIIAGGTDVITGIQMQSKRFSGINRLIDINKIAVLKKIEESKDKIQIGSGVTFTEIMNNPLAQKRLPLLTKAAATVGNLQIRNRATIAGNFINNAPCADSVPALLVYEAIIQLESADENRQVPLEQFLTGTYKTQIQPNELVTQIIIPKSETNLKGDFYKLGRRKSVAISRLSFAVLAEIEDNVMKELRIAIGAITSIGERFPEIEKWAKGQQISDDLLKKISIKIAEKIVDKYGLRWSSPYKVPVIQQAVFQKLKEISD